MEALVKNPNIKIRDIETVKEKFRQIQKGGKNDLMIISDFDYTITKFYKTVDSSYSNSHMIFDHHLQHTDMEEYLKVKEFNSRYLQIEKTVNMTKEEKTTEMIKMFKATYQNIVDRKISKDDLEEIVKKADWVMKDRVKDFFETLALGQIPIVLFSAGIVTVIEVFLRQQIPDALLSQTHTCGNRMLFDENNVCVGIKQPFIHCYNKGGAMLPKDDPYFHEYAIRQNVVMFGDSLGDLTMHHGVERTGALLTVALCNYADKPELVEKYEKLYDIVVVGDESFDVPIQIVEKVLKG